MRIKTVTCKSGNTGWQAHLHDIFLDYEDFRKHSDTYNLATRLGYTDSLTAWNANPVVEGSHNPSDYRKVS